MAERFDPLPPVELARGYDSSGRRRGNFFFSAFIGAVTFVLTCLCLHALLPFPQIPDVTPKLEYFAAHKDEFDILFVGSSRIYRHIVPETFDRIAAEHGLRTRGFNLGVPGMHPPESFYVLEQALATKPTNLKWVFIELEELYVKWPEEKRDTRRFLYWHNWPSTWLAVEEIADPDGERNWPKIMWQSVRSRNAATHVSMMLKNYANVGSWRDFLDSLDGSRADEKRHLFDDGRGYQPRTGALSAEEKTELEENIRDRTISSRAENVSPITEEGFRKCSVRVKENGAALVCVVPPILRQTQISLRDSTTASILAFNDASKYPDLYDPARHVNLQHLTPEGAGIFTRALAERFAAEIAGVR